MILGIFLAIILLCVTGLISFFMNAHEEKYEVTNQSGLQVGEDGELTETITATFHRA